VPAVKACLIDVYDTILSSSYAERAAALAEASGIPLAQWSAAWLGIARERDDGTTTMAGAFARTLLSCGQDPDPALVDRLVALDAELIISRTSVCPDTVPFLEAVRADGIRVALVSNCAPNTRPMLAAKGLLDLADAAILSCEVGVAKPAPEIYQIALTELGVLAAEAIFLDDQPRFCEGAAAVGIRAIQVVRPGVATRPADPRFSPVTSLADVPSLR
jgi:HAD superfamily hydrolase (TIGR01509 family)